MIKRNIMIRVTPEQSKQIQEICFANGICWSMGGTEVMHTDSKGLLINKIGIFCISNELFHGEYFCHKYEEVDAKFFIKTQGTCVEENQEQGLKQNIEEEQMKNNEVETYKDVKEYLVAKGLYHRVMEIEWDYEREPSEFNRLFIWDNVDEGWEFWNMLDEDLIKLGIAGNIVSLVQDYKAKKGKEFIQYLETQPAEVVDEAPEQPTEAKPKQYMCFCPTKGKPKHIHQSLESAQEEAKRLCKSGLCEVMVLEVVSKYQAKVIVEVV